MSCFCWRILLILGVTSDLNVVSHQNHWFVRLLSHFIVASFALSIITSLYVVNLRERMTCYERTQPSDEHNEVLATHISLSLLVQWRQRVELRISIEADHSLASHTVCVFATALLYYVGLGLSCLPSAQPQWPNDGRAALCCELPIMYLLQQRDTNQLLRAAAPHRPCLTQVKWLSTHCVAKDVSKLGGLPIRYSCLATAKRLNLHPFLLYFVGCTYILKLLMCCLYM